MKNKIIILFACVLFLTSCSKSPSHNNDDTVSENKNVKIVKFSETQTQGVVDELINTLIATKLLKQTSRNRNVVAIKDIANLTNLQVDTELITKKVKISLLNSGKVVVTRALDEEYHGKKGSIYSPNFVLNGKIQKNNDDFLLKLTLINPKNGSILWKDEKILTKG